MIVIRLAMSAVLIYFIWQETGWATATAITLITIGSECTSYVVRNLIKCVKNIVGMKG